MWLCFEAFQMCDFSSSSFTNRNTDPEILTLQVLCKLQSLLLSTQKPVPEISQPNSQHPGPTLFVWYGRLHYTYVGRGGVIMGCFLHCYDRLTRVVSLPLRIESLFCCYPLCIDSVHLKWSREWAVPACFWGSLDRLYQRNAIASLVIRKWWVQTSMCRQMSSIRVV